MKIETTYTARIYVGFRERYTDTIHSVQEVRDWLQEYCDVVGFCVTIEQTEFIYKNGSEPGCVVGIINYPRFPETFLALRGKAVYIAEHLRELCNQGKVSIVFPDETVMIEAE